MTVTETTFVQHVLKAALPAVVCFVSPSCEASQALAPLLDQLAAEYRGQLVVASVDALEEPLLAEQFHVQAVPSLLVFCEGEERTREIGFAPASLVRLLFAQVVNRDLPRGWLWNPTEATFEDLVIVPLVARWGFTYARQASCRPMRQQRSGRGRVDFVVYADDLSQPLTLFENKRNLLTRQALEQAANQGRGYAQALDLPSFVVASPSGMWVYARKGQTATLVHTFSSLDLHRCPDDLKLLLLELAKPC